MLLTQIQKLKTKKQKTLTFPPKQPDNRLADIIELLKRFDKCSSCQICPRGVVNSNLHWVNEDKTIIHKIVVQVARNLGHVVLIRRLAFAAHYDNQVIVNFKFSCQNQKVIPVNKLFKISFYRMSFVYRLNKLDSGFSAVKHQFRSRITNYVPNFY